MKKGLISVPAEIRVSLQTAANAAAPAADHLPPNTLRVRERSQTNNIPDDQP